MPRAKAHTDSESPRPPHRRDKADPRSVPFVVRLRPAERDHLAALAKGHGIPLADLVRRRLFEWQLPRPQVDLQTAQQYAVLHSLSLALRGAVSNLNGLARAYHSGFPVEGAELVESIAMVRSQVDVLRLELAGQDGGAEWSQT